MSYVIDGHNLIPKISGLSLAQVDDETRLIRLLMTFCQKKKSRAVVFFDRAAPGHQGGRAFGAVSAIFVSDRRKADDAIHDYLAAHRREARNFTVVSSDRQVQRDATSLHAQVLSAENFADLLVGCIISEAAIQGEAQPEPLSPEEINEWERLFRYYDN
jgi:predicted RNA-binding protein with PIN domain